ncbi:DUF1918 domain-containing protein [Cellulomonas fimi]|uniref:DUF1918 domain-containing protein n=1 Tax=Cellulomonas fimi (strain ATCC 484 / DSM 20113 / JCM 1341 / CCUG 24087 / LMG 16345 / NBRC 15513 / NCIMB 8980 / NCTC 7547 / NRS-133) TaxID=590998 RepID=F4H4L0_CELFA|nr:DUF1918 domain-containing protein [Cellulomonas fimi]AEE47805.1 Domain of unknown function DUF1918 [Cellulomonas fimi ATCC 484]NNH06057.1 DUF1918 domain-containing protein [Cellulomonas fimi]VEH37038.1 Domain of uncharacterised function (DUF1918) [Cellulomonas fimi]
MHAEVGDKVVVHGRTVGTADRCGTVVEARGADGPYLVRFDDGHESLVFPGPDVSVESHAS